MVVIEFDDDVQVIKGKDDLKVAVEYWVEEIESGAIANVKFSTDNTEAIYEIIEGWYDKFILAAGGAVLNDHNEVLVIFRNVKWDLPKGKVEKGEQVELGAIREVMEETGLENVKIVSKLPKTYHTYLLKGKRVLKETYWFLMASNDEEIRPLAKEGIKKVEWLPESGLDKVMSNTYENIKLILREIFH